MKTFKRQILPRFRWSRRLRRASYAFWLITAALTMWTAIDFLLFWHFEIITNYHANGETSDFPGFPWGYGWEKLFDDEDSNVVEITLPSGRLYPIFMTAWPFAAAASTAALAGITRRYGRLPQNPTSSSRGTIQNRGAKTNATKSRKFEWTQLITATPSLVSIAALLFTALSLEATRDQIEVATEAQITNRYTQAVQLLGTKGEDARDVRLGAIYALERLTFDSPRDEISVRNLLGAYVRQHAARPVDGKPCPEAMPADIQAALNIIVSPTIETLISNHPQDLRNTCLAKANLKDALLEYADLTDSDLSYAVITNANLREAKLRNTNLTGANLFDAYGRDADFEGANLTKTTLTGCSFSEGIFKGANLSEAKMSGADLREVDFHGRQVRPDFPD